MWNYEIYDIGARMHENTLGLVKSVDELGIKVD